jgi:hypothetical protein
MSGALGDFALISMADKYFHRDMALRGSGANRRWTRTRAGQRR